MGDFNAKIGQIDCAKFWVKSALGIPEQVLATQTGNRRGRKLGESVVGINQVIINGRVTDDQPATSTYIGGSGESLLDLAIIFIKDFDLIQSF